MTTFKAVPIGHLVTSVDNWNPARDAPGQEFEYIDLGSVDNNSKHIIGHQRLVGRNAPSRARQLVRAEDILVSTVRPNLNGVARVTNEFDGATASTGFCVLRPKEKALDGSYLFHWVISKGFIEDMVRKATGASYPAVSDRIIFESEIPLPPLAEQKRIAGILNCAHDLIQLRQRALVKAESLKQALFMHSFGTARSDIEFVSLSEVTTRVTDGVHQKPEYTEHGVPFISVKDITTGILNFDSCKFISQKDHDIFSKRCRAERGDILYTKVGATYGRPAIVDTDREFSLYVSVCLIKPRRDKIDPMFLCTALGLPALKSQADRRIKGIGVPDLHLDQIREFQIPLPPLEEQKNFTRYVAYIDELISKQRRHLSQFNALFASLQHRAFRGELTSKTAEREFAEAS